MEISWNFVSPEKWEPCLENIFVDISGFGILADVFGHVQRKYVSNVYRLNNGSFVVQQVLM